MLAMLPRKSSLPAGIGAFLYRLSTLWVRSLGVVSQTKRLAYVADEMREAMAY